MPQKDLHHRLTGDSSSLEAASNRGAASMSKMEREARRLEAQQRRTDRAMETTGRTMLAVGAAIATGLALSVKAAIDWETAWAGVQKTVDGTEAQMAALEEEIRDLTSVLPASHAEIAAVAEAAGQLGIRRQDVAAFTETMINLGVATNLSATEAATALARMMNIMQTAPEDVDRLGAAIVDLGNNSATTEAEIVEMALRIAGAGNQIGLTEAEVLAFSATLSSVGIRAQAGGTAISKVFLEIDTAARQGGETLEVFARTAGMSAADFQRAYQQDAAGAIATFVEGLGRVQQSGGDVNEMLEQLGLTETRVADALRRMSGAGDLLTASLGRSTQAWDENVALLEEAERRYGTTEAKAQIARNQINDFAIDIGQTFLPAVGDVLATLGSLADLFGDLPGPVKTLLAILAAAVAAIALVGGTALIAVPRIHQMRIALDQLAASGTRAAAMVGVFRTVTSFLTGPWGIAIGLGVAALTAYGLAQAKTQAQIKELSGTLNEQNGAVTENTRLWIANELANREANKISTITSGQYQDFVENLDDANVSMRTAVDAVTGNADAMEELTSRHAELTAAIDDTDDARLEERDALAELIEVIEEESGKLEEAQELQRLLAEGTSETEDATKSLTPEARNLADAFGVSAGTAEELAGQLDDLDKELRALFDSAFGLTRAEDELTQQFRALIEQVEDGTTELTGNSDAAIENRRAIEDLIEKHGEVVQKMIETGASNEDVAEKTDEFREELLAVADQLGLNEDELAIYLSVLDAIPETVSTSIHLDITDAQQKLRELGEANARLGGGRGTAPQFHQHGGFVRGPSDPPDRVPIMATGGEFVVRREVAQRNAAALQLANATGARLMVAGTHTETMPSSVRGSDGGGLPSNFTAAAVIDLGEGIRKRVAVEFERHDREMDRMVTQGVGAAR